LAGLSIDRVLKRAAGDLPAPMGQTAARPSLRVGLILAENFTLSAFALFTDHLRLAADEGDLSRPVRVRWSIMARSPEPIRASCGVMLTPTAGLLSPKELDYVVVVGGILHAGRQIDAATGDYLRRVAEAGTPLVGLCTGSFILCRERLMKDRRTCVSWYHYQDFLETFPDQAVVADRLFLEDQDRITCAGGAGTADLAIHLIERHLSRAVAQKASQVLLFDRARAGGEAQPHPPLSQAFADPRVRRASLIMEQNLSSPIAISEIAAQLGLSTRQFERLCHDSAGLSPGALYRRLRLRYAAWLVETTSRSIMDIALEAGFADASHFTRQFKACFGLPPSKRRLNNALAPVGERDSARTRVFSGSARA
jgi:transcriptional regulator GlxA family with amidase domain